MKWIREIEILIHQILNRIGFKPNKYETNTARVKR